MEQVLKSKSRPTSPSPPPPNNDSSIVSDDQSRGQSSDVGSKRKMEGENNGGKATDEQTPEDSWQGPSSGRTKLNQGQVAKVYRCTTCRREFMSARELNVHKIVHRRERDREKRQRALYRLTISRFKNPNFSSRYHSLYSNAFPLFELSDESVYDIVQRILEPSSHGGDAPRDDDQENVFRQAILDWKLRR